MAPQLQATLLAEAGGRVGLGHLTRCVALFDALRSSGCECRLVVAGDAPRHVVGDRDVDILEWRELPAVKGLLAGVDVAVVDSYEADLSVYQAVSGAVCVAVYLDDTARLPYPEGIVVNGNPDADHLPLDVSGPLLTGVRHQLLRAEFSEAPARETRPSLDRVLVVSGGTDAGSVLDALSTIVADACPEAVVDAVSAPRTATEMREAMLGADVAVSAAGQTLYELASTSTPTVAVCVAANQVAQAHAFERAGAVLLAGEWGRPETPGRIAEGLRAMASQEVRARMAAAGRALIDGRGAHRVARSAVSRCVDSRVSMRVARQDDEVPLLELANEPGVRTASFDSNPISPETHHAWFASRLGDENTLLLVFMYGEELAGYVRFACEGADAEVSIALAPSYRGLGLAQVWLVRAMSELALRHPEVQRVVARVRAENLASRRLFGESGFTAEEGDSESGQLALVRTVLERT